MTTVVEVVTYKLKPNTNTEQIEATHSGVNSFCAGQPGFLYRSLSHDKQNVWFDIVYWQDMACAKAAGEVFRTNAVCQLLMDLIDSDTVVMRHMQATTEIIGTPAT